MKAKSIFLAVAILTSWLALTANAQDAISLIDPHKPTEGWTFNNGAEFPGATGTLTTDNEASRAGHGSLKLVGDFTKGGGYVQAGRKIEGVDIRELSLWIRNPDSDRFTLRLNDTSGQTHQIVVKTEATPGWQQIVLPLERFFAKRGEADAVTTIAKYESWGGAKDGQWHGPATAIYLLVSKGGENKVRTLWLNEVMIVPRPTAVPGAEVVSVIRLDEILEGEHDWRFSRGEEFPGAKGSFTVVEGEPALGQSCLELAGDFTGGGGYVAAIKSLAEWDVKDISVVRLRVKTANATSISVQLVDGSGQTHQRKGVKITANDQWHDFAIAPAEIAGGEHWGGANDAKWHAPLKQLAISVTPQSDEKAKQPVLYLADIRAEALLPVFVQSATFKQDFETPQLDERWTKSPGVSIDAKSAFKGSGSLLLARTLEKVNEPCTATSPTFAAAPGQWEFRLACKSDLHSPDNSYSAVVQLEGLDGSGKVVEQIPLTEVFGRRDWQPVKQRVEIPKGVVSARIDIQLHKTYGQFWIDDLSAAYLAPAPRKDDRVTRLLFSTAQLGNLLFPDDSRQVSVTVEARKPLRESQHTLSYVVRDYWGAEQSRPVTVALGRAEKKGATFTYATTIDLAGVPLEIGRYYELHTEIPQEGGEPFRNYTSLAILPEAETKRFKPEEVPFTSRNWDNRISEYVRLSDRLGVRICGIWGGWSSKPPYKAEAPTLDLCRKLGMGWLTTTPIATIERGQTDYDEQALRQGVRNLIEQYGEHRPLIINLGNEPHGTGDRVLKNVAAYRAVYEEVKKIDPTIPVVATSVEPNEEYFRAGYGQWCDAYDFHIYEEYPNVRRTMDQYRELAKKYGHVKPIWSTELGLNSQGMTRHAVAVELIKKFTTFFAAGGQNVSWFGLLYPDPEGKLHGTSGNAHNIFDCRYNRYAPRLDAVAYYNAVNAIAIKKFVEEKQYAGGINAFLFRDRDGRSLQVLWKDHGREDISIPLTGIEEVQIVRIDGSRRTLNAKRHAVTLSVSPDPLLIVYQGGANSLAEMLGTPLAEIDSPPLSISRQGTTTLAVSTKNDSMHKLELIAPPFWTAQKTNAGFPGSRWELTPPVASQARELDVTVEVRDKEGNRIGELYHRAAVQD